MNINIDRGARRMLTIISISWILFALAIIISDLSFYRGNQSHLPTENWDKYKVQKPIGKFVDTIAQQKAFDPDKFLREQSDAKKPYISTLSDNIFRFISDRWLSIIGILFVPIALLWSGYYSIKYSTKWIIAGFQNK